MTGGVQHAEFGIVRTKRREKTFNPENTGAAGPKASECVVPLRVRAASLCMATGKLDK